MAAIESWETGGIIRGLTEDGEVPEGRGLSSGAL